MISFKEKKYYSMSFVLLGAFSPFMFQPEWFRHNNVLSPDDYESIERSDKSKRLISSQLSFFETDKIAFHIGEERFQITSKREPFLLAFDALRLTFENLSSIPISAYGVNYEFHYDVENAEDMKTIGDIIAPKKYWKELFSNDNYDNSASGLTGIVFTKKTDSYQLNVKFAVSNKLKRGIMFDFNFHHNCGSDTTVEDVVDSIHDTYQQYGVIASNVASSLADSINEEYENARN